MEDCIFCKIVRGEIPCAKLYENELVLSFLDINPINPGHALVIPKNHYDTLFEVPSQELEACALAAQKVGKAVHEALGAHGMNFLQNNFEAAGQLIMHAHFHLIPRYEDDGFMTSWPGKSYPPGQLDETLRKVQEKL
jgi:histidine triad (HIT) family protein